MVVKENPNSKQPRRSKKNLEDLTQRLPDPIIAYILGLLKCTKKSIQTSVLSKRWESFWASAPILTFSQHDDRPFPILLDEFCSRVDKTLIQCNSDVNLEAFNLSFAFEEESKPQVDRWLRHATRRNVKAISLYFHGEESYRLPLFLCRCSSLTDLDIDGGIFPPLPIRFSWSSLKFLSLRGPAFRDGIEMYEELFEAIQSSCPLLEKWYISMEFGEGVYRFKSLSLKSLSLGNSEGPPLAVIQIRAPNLNTFDINGHWEAINFIDVASLLEVEICYNVFKYMSPKCMNQALRKLHGVEKFTFYLGCTYEVFSELQATRMTPIVLENCKDLDLEMYLSDVTLPDLLFLLNVSPNLKKLILRLNIDRDEGEGEWEMPKSSFACLNSHLTTIDVICFDPRYELRSEHFCGFLKFVLGKAVVLEKLRIITDDRCKFEKSASHWISSYKKASRNAVVQFVSREAYWKI